MRRPVRQAVYMPNVDCCRNEGNCREEHGREKMDSKKRENIDIGRAQHSIWPGIMSVRIPICGYVCACGYVCVWVCACVCVGGVD